MKKNKIVYIIIIIIALAVLFSLAKNSKKNDQDVVAQNGLHWHPEISIFVKGVKQEVPTNIGVGPQYSMHKGYDQNMRMTAVHTHDEPGVIHFEFPGKVYKEDLTLSQFFKIWGKDIRSFGTNMKMMVNGVENNEYENYMMNDKDKIELFYE